MDIWKLGILKRLTPLVLFVLFGGVSLAGVANGQATRSSATVQSIKTYPFGDPSPVPLLNKKPQIYPYFRFDGYTDTGRSEKWKVISLENDHIQLSILPQVGGKVFGAVDKATGKEFIYKNDVLKFRDIGLRGPWASGGIEFNFGYIGHTPSTSTPVDYTTKENEDGSVSVFVGGLDLASRTKWRVEIKLPADKAFFQTNSFWYNSTPFHQSYYQWMNAAIAAGDDLQMYFPGTNHIFHDGKGGEWPVNENGKKISVYKNNNFGSHKSYHVLGKYHDYSAAYWHNSNFGYGHWARHDEMPGQKVWMWAQSRSGAIWEDLLTDSAGQYVEVQNGRLFNQANLGSGLDTPFDQYLFEPKAFDSWQEYWFPIKGIGGVSDASRFGAMHVTREKQTLRIALNAIQKISDSLVVTVEGERLQSEKINIRPTEVYETEIELPEKSDNYTVHVGNKLNYSSIEKEVLERPIHSDEIKTTGTVEYKFQRAEEQLALREYVGAMDLYKDVIAETSNHRGALTRIAELYVRRGEYNEALKYTRRVLQEDTYDAGANFVYGTINQKLGRATQAKDAFGWAARSMEYRSGSFAQMAQLYLGEGNYREAIYYAQKALDYNTYNLEARQTKAIAFRVLGDNTKAKQEQDTILEIDPLSHFARVERFLSEPNDENKTNFTSLIRNELPHETYLELGINYYNMGRLEEAKNVFELAPDHPVIEYWQAYLNKNNATLSKEYLQNAVDQSPRLVFPFRTETIDVLEWALQKNKEWQSRYYLGLVLWHKGRVNEAVQLFKECGNRLDFVPFYLTRSELLKERDPEQAGQDLKHALELNSDQWRTYRALTEWYASQNEPNNALQLSQKANKKFPGNYYLGMQYASVLNSSGQFEKALKTLSDLQVLPFEGATEGHQLYENAHLMLALEYVKINDFKEALTHIEKSRQWPEHLGVGRPYNPDNRFQDFLEAHINRVQGNAGKARALTDNILEYSLENWDSVKSENFSKGNFVSYLVFEEAGEEKKAEKFLKLFKQQLGDKKFNVLNLNKGLDSGTSDNHITPRWLQMLRDLK